MNTQEAILVPLCIADTTVDAINEMYDEITQRAYEIFLARGGVGTLDLEDWLKAEQQLLFKPEARIEQTDHGITVTIRIGHVNLTDLQVLITPDAMVIQAEDVSANKTVFRSVEFPKRIDVNKAGAVYRSGSLVLTA
jgi:HSP20 family molecular chaperone IbpA